MGDAKINLWDPRAQSPLTSSTDIMDGCKVYTMALHENRLIAGTSKRHVVIYDMRNMSQTEQLRESSLMNQTRSIRIFTDGTGYALSSIEGRVAIEFFDPSPHIQKKKYAFKCHRKVDPVTKQSTLYPVNCIAFHPVHGTFATGGCDGIINVWDGLNKKRICQYPPYPTSIASLSFNNTGNRLAIASSYTFEQGEQQYPSANAIFIRAIHDHEVQRKGRVHL